MQCRHLPFDLHWCLTLAAVVGIPIVTHFQVHLIGARLAVRDVGRAIAPARLFDEIDLITTSPEEPPCVVDVELATASR